MRRLMTLSLVVVINILSPVYCAPSSDNVYREAVLQETTARDLGRASTLYQEVIKDPQAERSLKANAYLRLGVCQNKLGQPEAARMAWSQVLENYADQSETYQEAKGHLQELQAQAIPERPAPKEAPRTRVALQFPSVGYSSTDGFIITGPALHYYWKRQWATGLEYTADLVTDPSSQPLDVTYYGLTTLREWTVVDVIHPFLKAGPGLYRFSLGYEGDRSKWTGGLLTEAGVSISATRGFFATFAVSQHTVAQPHIPAGQNVWEPGLRSVIRSIWVPRFAIGYRW